MTDVYSKVSKIDEDGTLMALQFQEFLIIVQDYYMGLGVSISDPAAVYNVCKNISMHAE